jgi:hypothetical protein
MGGDLWVAAHFAVTASRTAPSLCVFACRDMLRDPAFYATTGIENSYLAIAGLVNTAAAWSGKDRDDSSIGGH